MTIELPEGYQRMAEQFAAAAGCESVDAYLMKVVVEHFEAAKEREQKLAEIRAMIANSEEEYARGETVELTEEQIEQWKTEGRARQANRG